MLTVNFVESLETIDKSLALDRLSKLLSPLVDLTRMEHAVTAEHREELARQIMSTRENYVALDADAHRVAEAIGIHEMLNPLRATSLVLRVATVQGVKQILTNTESFEFFRSFASEVAAASTFVKGTIELLGEKTAMVREAGTLDLVIPDVGEDGLPTGDLSEVLQQAEELHYVASRVLPGSPGEGQPRLRVVFLDTGTDFLVLLRSGKEIVDLIGNTLWGAWQAVRFYRHESFDRTMRSMGGGLDMLARITELEGTGALPPAEAENLRQRTVSGIGRLMGRGVTPRGGLILTGQAQRQLPAPSVAQIGVAQEPPQPTTDSQDNE